MDLMFDINAYIYILNTIEKNINFLLMSRTDLFVRSCLQISYNNDMPYLKIKNYEEYFRYKT